MMFITAVSKPVNDAIRAAYEQGYREGQERMRERIAALAEGSIEDFPGEFRLTPVEPAPEGKP